MKKIAKIFVSMFVLNAVLLSSAATVGAETNDFGEQHSTRDYTQAPYYNALQEWFDFCNYTENQREKFMNDTETLDWILYSDEYWNNGGYSFTSLGSVPIEKPMLTSASFPVAGYEAGTYFSSVRGRPACTHHSYNNCTFDGKCGCGSFDNSIQCLGFAKFVYWTRTGSSMSANGQLKGLYNWSEAEIKKYIVNNLNIGSHIRFHVKGKNFDHSVIVTSISNTQIGVYDANWDNQCGIRMTTMSWADIYKNFDYIDYSNYFYG